MNLFYKVAYRLGFKPWERAALRETDMISRLFDREEGERQPPYGPVLDLGCGTGMQVVELALRGWQVTGVEIVPKALRAAQDRVRNAGVEAQLIEGDVTALRELGIGRGFQLVLDFGLFHGLEGVQREAMGREVSAVTVPGATMLMIAWVPGRRWPLPRGATAGDIEAAFPSWRVIGEDPLNVSALPGPLKKVEPKCYRLRRG